MPIYPSQDSGVRGELSPRLHARASIDLYRAGYAICENWIPLPHGGVRKRGGTRFVAEVKDSSKLTIGLPYIYDADQAYCLEVGEEYLRIYAYEERVGTVELSHDYTEDYLRNLQITASFDVAWITEGSQTFQPYKLTRSGALSWSLDALAFTDGPFQPENVDTSQNMYVDAATATTLTADFNIFDEDIHVGRLVRIDAGSDFGIARITAVTSATVATVTTLADFPAGVVGVGNKTELWRLGVFGPTSYPSASALFEERLVMSSDIGVFLTKSFGFSASFTLFATGSNDSDGMEFPAAGGSRIQWLLDADGQLAIGTINEVRGLSGSGIDVALTASSFKVKRSRASGASRVPPVAAEDNWLYVPRGRKDLHELALNQTLRFFATDLGQISEHIYKKGVLDLQFQHDPDPIAWMSLETGELGGFTYWPAQEVRGTHRHTISGASEYNRGVVESVVVTPGQSGTDDVWLFVRRAINGQTRRYIEVLTTPFENGAIEDAFQVDCGLTYSGAATGTVTGLSYLEGETVTALADGTVYSGLTVSGGEVTLPGGATASKITVGLPATPLLETLELDVGGRDGSIRGRPKRIVGVILSLLETDLTGLEVAAKAKGRYETVRVENIEGEGAVSGGLYTGNVRVPIDATWNSGGKLLIRHTKPTPATIRAIIPEFDAAP